MVCKLRLFEPAYDGRCVESDTFQFPEPSEGYIHWSSSLWIFVEFIPRRSLEGYFGSPLGARLNTLWVVWTLRGLHSPTPCGSPSQPQFTWPHQWFRVPHLRCIGHYFTKMGAGPVCLLSGNVFSGFRKYRLTLQLEQSSSSDITQEAFGRKPALFFRQALGPLVLTHGDISINNIRLGFRWRFFLAYGLGNVPGLTLNGFEILFCSGVWVVEVAPKQMEVESDEGHEDVEELGRNEEGSFVRWVALGCDLVTGGWPYRYLNCLGIFRRYALGLILKPCRISN